MNDDVVPFTRDEKVFVNSACTVFVCTLKDAGLLGHPQLFETLRDIAFKYGYALHAHQGGIRGTFICFEPKGDLL